MVLNLSQYVAIMTSVHRVVISPATYKALQAEAMVRQSSIQAVMDAIIMDNISQQARDILRTIGSIEHVELKTVGIIERMDKPGFKPENLACQSSKRPKQQLGKDEAAVARIKELWTTTDTTVVDIAMEIDRPRQTIETLIKRLINRGELAPRAKSGQQTSKKV